MITITAQQAVRESKRYQFYLNGEIIQLVQTAYVSENEGEEVQGWLDYAEHIKDEHGNPKRDKYGNIMFVPKDVEVAKELSEFNKIAETEGLDDYGFYAVEPKITRLEGKVKWVFVNSSDK